MTDDTKHFPGCWRLHHACALAEVIRLQVTVRHLETQGRSIVPEVSIVPCSDPIEPPIHAHMPTWSARHDDPPSYAV